MSSFVINQDNICTIFACGGVTFIAKPLVLLQDSGHLKQTTTFKWRQKIVVEYNFICIEHLSKEKDYFPNTSFQSKLSTPTDKPQLNLLYQN